MTTAKIVKNIFRDFYWKRLNHFFLKYLLTYNQKKSEHPDIFFSGDPVRTCSIYLALKRLDQEGIQGDCAEVGVFRGDLSKIIKRLSPSRRFYLFDTFKGFPEEDLKGVNDDRFKDTTLDYVKQNIGNTENIEFRIGYFPDSALGLEAVRFAFVMLDTDKYESILAGLRFFYPRMVRGGYLFIHDFNSPESDWGVSRAVNQYLSDKTEKPIELPDGCGSLVLRKS